jgi:hypothetical protein
VSDSRSDRTQKKENTSGNLTVKNDKEELNNILEQISESAGKKETPAPRSEEPEEIIKKPEGIADQPEDIEGMLSKLTEKPQQKRGIFQRILDFFRKF